MVSFTSGRRPQCAQKGSPAAVGFPHHPQGTLPGGAWTRVGGTIATAGCAAERRMGEGDGRRCEGAGFGGALVAGTTLAAGGASGFPQSMQNRESAALPRPQKAQDIKQKPPGRSPV